MKKILTLAMAATTAMAMNAEVYLVGNYDLDDLSASWSPENAVALTRTTAGWETTLNIQTFKISTAGADDWMSFNDYALTVSQPVISKSDIGRALRLQPLYDDINFDLPWRGDWHIVVSADYSTITMTTTTPDPSTITTAYVLGEMNDWTPTDMWKMETTDGRTYTFVCEGETAIEAETEFKLGSHNWAGINYTVGGLIDPEYSPYYVGYNTLPPVNMWFDETFTGTIKLVLTGGLTGDAEISFIPAETPTPPTPPTPPVPDLELFICGNWDDSEGWDPLNPKVFGINADGNYEITIEGFQSFKISLAKGIEDDYSPWYTFDVYALTKDGSSIINADEVGQPFALVYGYDNINLPWKGDWTIVVANDLSTMTVTTTTVPPAGFTPAYVVGEMTDWTFLPEWEMTTTDGITYTIELSGERAMDANVEFKVATPGYSGINHSVYGEIYSYGVAYEGLYNVQGNMWFTEPFTGTVLFRLTNGLHKDGELEFLKGQVNGIAGVEADNNGEVEYYNLQGVRVANPENGLFIMRHGSEVKKIVK